MAGGLAGGVAGWLDGRMVGRLDGRMVGRMDGRMVVPSSLLSRSLGYIIIHTHYTHSQQIR